MDSVLGGDCVENTTEDKYKAAPYASPCLVNEETLVRRFIKIDEQATAA